MFSFHIHFLSFDLMFLQKQFEYLLTRYTKHKKTQTFKRNKQQKYGFEFTAQTIRVVIQSSETMQKMLPSFELRIKSRFDFVELFDSLLFLNSIESKILLFYVVFWFRNFRFIYFSDFFPFSLLYFLLFWLCFSSSLLVWLSREK